MLSATRHGLKIRIALTLLVGFIPVALSAQGSFSDGTFNDTDWNAVAIWNSTEPAATFSAQQMTSGGNPGAYRDVKHTLPSAGNLFVAHSRNGAIYNPGTQGAISSISFSHDLIHIDQSSSIGQQVA